MAHRIKRRLENLIDNYAALCLSLALVILSLIGVGDVRAASLVGLLLCGVGVTQDSAKADLWTLLPLIFYDLAAMASSLYSVWKYCGWLWNHARPFSSGLSGHGLPE